TVTTPRSRIDGHWERVGWPAANRPSATLRIVASFASFASFAAVAGAVASRPLGASIDAQAAADSTPARAHASSGARTAVRSIDITRLMLCDGGVAISAAPSP